MDQNAQALAPNTQMTRAEFTRIAQLVHLNTGILLEEHKKQMVQARIARRLRALELSDYASYLDLLDTTPGEIEHFTNALTTNLTAFFRETHHFDRLREHLSLLNAPKLRIWSAGCSTGEEPYSIALVCKNIPTLKNADLRVLATDIDSQALATAQAGRFSDDKREAIPNTYTNHLLPGPEGFTISQDVKNIISFKRLNLLEPWPFTAMFDFIFCRNVIIYFDKATKLALISRFASQLAPGGLLFLGHSETLVSAIPNLKSLGKTTYQRELA